MAKGATTPATSQKPHAQDQTFTHGDGEKKRTFKILLGKMNIPGKGVMTASDVATDPEAQKYLVEEINCLGSALDEVFDQVDASSDQGDGE